MYTNRTNLWLEYEPKLCQVSFYPVLAVLFSVTRTSAGSHPSNVCFLVPIRKNCWSHEAAPAEPSCESYESSSLTDLWQKGSERGQERQRRRGSSASTLLEPRRLWVKSCVQRLSSLDAAAIAVGREAMRTAVRGVRLWRWRLRSRYLYPRSSIFLYW